MNESICQIDQCMYEVVLCTKQDAPSLKDRIIQLIQAGLYDNPLHELIEKKGNEK